METVSNPTILRENCRVIRGREQDFMGVKQFGFGDYVQSRANRLISLALSGLDGGCCALKCADRASLGAPSPLKQGTRSLQAGSIGAEQRLGLQGGIRHSCSHL
jgi:hypothetical protein